MAAWAATQAKAKFSEVLDCAEQQGPQRIERRKKRFVLLTEEQYAKHAATPVPTKSAQDSWDAMRPSFERRYDVDFPRLKGGPRPVDLG